MKAHMELAADRILGVPIGRTSYVTAIFAGLVLCSLVYGSLGPIVELCRAAHVGTEKQETT